jgi:hypothetical protein
MFNKKNLNDNEEMRLTIVTVNGNTVMTHLPANKDSGKTRISIRGIYEIGGVPNGSTIFMR